MDAIVVSGELTEPTDIDSWSWAEVLVVVGWLSGLITCCLALRKPVQMLLGPTRPAETKEQGNGGFTDSVTGGRGINANYLMHSSRFFNPEGQGEGQPSSHARSNSSLLLLQKGRQQRTSDTGHGGQSLASTVRYGAKNRHGKDERELEKILGKGLVDPVEVLTQTKLTGMKLAYQLATSTKNIRNAVNKLKSNFWAPSSRAARDIKRSEVVRLARLVAGTAQQVFPLTQEVVEGVAACIKDANMKSGDQYLNELKLCHIEQGFDLPPWLVRTLAMCKKALMRNKGPVKRAIEAKLEDIEEEQCATDGADADNGINPALSYAWACLWMLREIEASECKWEHIQMDRQRKTVSLMIPISKMDQDAKGIKRTLQCCGENVCSRFCAWNVWLRMVEEFPKRKEKKGYLFTDKFKGKLNKNKMIEAWRKVTRKQVTGHSARRSGAMEHVRRGLQLQELAFLGRWKSAVVLTYANDALQEVPANRNGRNETQMGNGTGTPMPWTPCRQPSTPMCLTPWVSKKRALPEQVEGEEEKQQNGENTAKQALWVSSCDSRKGKRVWHRVTNAGWQIPMAKWNTACGWNFTKNPEKVRLSVALQFNQTRCRKCSEVMKSRDLVREGKTLAGFITGEAVAMFGS